MALTAVLLKLGFIQVSFSQNSWMLYWLFWRHGCKSCVCVYNHIGLIIKRLAWIPNRVRLHTEAFTVWRFTIGNRPTTNECWARKGCSGRVKFFQWNIWLSLGCHQHGFVSFAQMLNRVYRTIMGFPTAPKCLLQIAIIGEIHDRLNFMKNPWHILPCHQVQIVSSITHFQFTSGTD